MSVNNRLGSLTLLLSGLFTFMGLWLRGAIANPSVDANAYARSVLSYSQSGAVLITASIFHLFGVLVIYSYISKRKTNRLALAAMILSVLGIALFLPFVGGTFVPAPTIGDLILNGNTQVIQVAEATIAGPLALFLLFSSLIPYIGGYFLFGALLWKQSKLMKIAGFALALHAPLVTIVASVSYVGELLGGFLLFIAGCGIVLTVMKERTFFSIIQI